MIAVEDIVRIGADVGRSMQYQRPWRYHETSSNFGPSDFIDRPWIFQDYAENEAKALLAALTRLRKEGKTTKRLNHTAVLSILGFEISLNIRTRR